MRIMIVLTMMVRDEIDIVESMLLHHVQQGVDAFIITDNGSVDGTWQVLEEFARHHQVDLRQDPVHRKQQASTVTAMARDAYSKWGADWVINADADEFWKPLDAAKTLHDVISHYSQDIGAFPVDVVNLTGEPARDGAAFARLAYRDLRTEKQLHEVGLRAQPTHNCLHIGSPDVEVIQGNHWTSIPWGERPEAALDIEVLHVPWRSWRQYESKILNMGESYTNNPDATPSPNHHGMRDYQRLLDGSLEAHYIVRHPSAQDLERGTADGSFTYEPYLVDRGLPQVPDVPYHLDYMVAARTFGAALTVVEERARDASADRDEYRGMSATLVHRLDDEYRARLEAEARFAEIEARISRRIHIRVWRFFNSRVLSAIWGGRRSDPAPTDAPS
jgi:hypothetical protein